ncbi:MAG: Ferric reductase-like protein transmembrane component-like protein [Parcubacteria group bacterium GW2011_GWA2_36_10]|nr:MAG: Ferric reductase-like protein transmembrane component-like protein [Parcubacteria group bacterium GW2011_GWA2_36_10]
MENEKSILPTKLFTWINYLQSAKFRKIIHYLFYGFIPIILLATVLLSSSTEIFAQIGEWAWQILILVLFIKPSIKILGFKELMWLLSYRRELGILCAYFAFAHLAGNIFSLKIYKIENYLPFNNFLFPAAIAAIIFIILYLTSNNASMRFLKKNWKRLQSLSYLLLPLISMHQILLKQEAEDLLGLFFLNIAFLILKILEYKKFTLSSLFRPREIKQ